MLSPEERCKYLPCLNSENADWFRSVSVVEPSEEPWMIGLLGVAGTTDNEKNEEA